MKLLLLLTLILITGCTTGTYENVFNNNLTGNDCNNFCKEQQTIYGCDEWISEWLKNLNTTECTCTVKNCFNNTLEAT